MKKPLLLLLCILSLFGCEKENEDTSIEIIADFAISIEYSPDYTSANVFIKDASLNVPEDGGAYYKWESIIFSDMGQHTSGWEYEGIVSKNGYYEIVLTIDEKYQKIRGIDITLLN